MHLQQRKPADSSDSVIKLKKRWYHYDTIRSSSFQPEEVRLTFSKKKNCSKVFFRQSIRIFYHWSLSNFVQISSQVLLNLFGVFFFLRNIGHTEVKSCIALTLKLDYQMWLNWTKGITSYYLKPWCLWDTKHNGSQLPFNSYKTVKVNAELTYVIFRWCIVDSFQKHRLVLRMKIKCLYSSGLLKYFFVP